MNLHFEKEFKILLDKDKFITLLNYYPQAEFKKQVNTYYDTEDMYIRKHIGAMRIREIDNHYIFTLKQRCKNGVQEHECIVDDNSLDAFQCDEIRALLTSFDVHQPIVKLASLTTYRSVILLDNAELCFDYNEYNGICDYELEYEYIRPHDGLSVFNSILALVDLKYEKNCMAKIRRALLSRNSDANGV